MQLLLVKRKQKKTMNYKEDKMKVEMLTTGNIEKILKDNNIAFNKTYSGDKYKVIEVDKKDAKQFSNSIMEGAWCKFSNGAGGSACDIFTVNGQMLIGWSNGHNDSYDTLSDYMKDELGVTDDDDVCDYAAGLAKANGMTMSKLFRFYEG